MDFDFSSEQEQLRDAVNKWVEKAYTFERRTSIVREGGFSPEVYQELSDLGFAGLYIASEHGGIDMGPVEGMVTMEELGRGLVMEPLVHTWIASALLQHFATPALQKDWLPRMATGEALVVLAHQERASRYQWQVCQAQAIQTGQEWSVTGHKSVVPAGDKAQAFLVPAMHQQQMALFCVSANAKGLQCRAYLAQDGSRMAEVEFKNASASLITTDGATALSLAVDMGIASMCAQAIGAMEKTLALTVEYMNTRKQFGVAIASFQALRHRVADMKMQLELGRSMSYYATLKLQVPEIERRRAMARAKYQLCQSMRYVGQQAVQLHGGIGVTDEYMVSHYFKALTQMEMMWGDGLYQLGQVSDAMQDTAGVFA